MPVLSKTGKFLVFGDFRFHYRATDNKDSIVTDQLGEVEQLGGESAQGDVMASLDWVFGKGFFEEVTQRMKLHGASHEMIKGHIALGRGNSLCQGPEVGTRLVCFKDRKIASSTDKGRGEEVKFQRSQIRPWLRGRAQKSSHFYV